MSRQKLIAGNWKMNLDVSGCQALANQLLKGAMAGNQDLASVKLAVFPASIHLQEVSSILKQSNISFGSQDVSGYPNGARTGQISCEMISDLGCRYAILGHSERRNGLMQAGGESDADINTKVIRCLETGVRPIVCVGELLEQREAGETEQVVLGQCKGSLAGLTEEQMSKVVIAYEPVWAIGTGKVATPEQAEEVHASIRSFLAENFGKTVGEQTLILYGGSVKPSNASDLLRKENIDGALVGGASLEADSFLSIAKAAGQALACS